MQCLTFNACANMKKLFITLILSLMALGGIALCFSNSESATTQEALATTTQVSKKKCIRCLGSGRCIVCHGKGYLTVLGQKGKRECNNCRGTGNCPRCKGTGVDPH